MHLFGSGRPARSAIGAIAASLLSACSSSPSPASPGKGDASTDAPAPPIVGSGLPCDVEQLLATRCQSCHGVTPTNGTPMSLVTYTDLTAPSPSDAKQKVAEGAALRMQSTDAQMPPPIATHATASEITTLQNWIQAGYPQGSCDLPANGGDPYYTATACSSNGHWQSGNIGSQLMHPGRACLTCHKANGGPSFAAAGTVFPSAHEPDDCNGFNGATGAKVVITDAHGQTVSAPVNTVGNFYWSESALTMPIHVKVVSKTGAERVMAEAPPTGDCNSCHTVAGTNNAPGRIMAP